MKVRKVIVRKSKVLGNWQVTFLGQGLWKDHDSRASWGSAMDCAKEGIRNGR